MPVDTQSDVSNTPQVARLADVVKFHRAEWVVLSATGSGRHLASNNRFQKSLTVDDGKFVLVQFKVKNLTKEKAAITPPKVRDSQGRVFEPVDEAAFYVPEDKITAGFMDPVPPAIPTEYWEPYQVADDSTGLVLLTHELADSEDVYPVALGL
jgi:hypothetical protein